MMVAWLFLKWYIGLDNFSLLGIVPLLCCFDKGAILEYMLVQVALTLATNWADIRHLSEIGRRGVGTQEARLGVEPFFKTDVHVSLLF